jgi:hypothetical protein
MQNSEANTSVVDSVLKLPTVHEFLEILQLDRRLKIRLILDKLERAIVATGSLQANLVPDACLDRQGSLSVDSFMVPSSLAPNVLVLNSTPAIALVSLADFHRDLDVQLPLFAGDDQKTSPIQSKPWVEIENASL